MDAWDEALSRAADPRRFGGKAARLAELIGAGFRVPPGFAVPVEAYEAFVGANRLDKVVEMELGRKPLAEMRWEELWDAALRIRTAFLKAPVPREMSRALTAAARLLNAPMAVRSSAPAEDSASSSFAGLHETVLDVSPSRLNDALRVVWSSLWSDAALLYRRELGLDPAHSRMAVVVQKIVGGRVSGVAFGEDPRAPDAGREIVEAVAGRCQALVDGEVDPDHWELHSRSGAVLTFRKGGSGKGPLLDQRGLGTVHQALHRARRSLGFVPDMEWTLTTALTVLQARPVTRPDRDKKRSWYLTLKPGGKELAGLRRRVTEQIIPALQQEGAAMAAEDLEGQDSSALARTLNSRIARLAHWRRVYEQDLIPFAHGVRRFGAHYAAVVKPPDPFEFVRILAGTDMLAARRNRMLEGLAARLRKSPRLAAAVKRRGLDADRGLAKAARRLLERSFDVEFAGERLSSREDILVANLLALATRPPHRRRRTNGRRLERRYLTRAADEGEAREILETARLSWRLRDDDNLLVGRLESQLLRAAEEAAARLRCRVPEPDQFAELAAAIAQGRRPRITAARAARVAGPKLAGKARQLIGQPAAPGLAHGRARIVTTAADLKAFQPGEVLVCDAIQPNMTHLVPLAAAIVERRGGMLIHGAIIARELGIPCVNGVPDAGRAVANGEELTVDGHLGIVSVGRPELDFELGRT